MTTISDTASLLRIDGFRFEELHIAPVDPAEMLPPGSVDVDFDLFVHPSERDRFAVGLRIHGQIESREIAEATPALSFVRLRVVGFFRTAEEISDGAVPQIVAANGMALLYGIVRGVVTTAGGWFDAATVLPSVNFSRMLAERASRDDAAAESHAAEKSSTAATKALRSSTGKRTQSQGKRVNRRPKISS